MKVKLVSEAVSAVTIGASFGLWINDCNQKLHTLGSDAFLVRKPPSMENLNPSPASGAHVVLAWILVALIVFALYKVLAIAIAGVLESFVGKSRIGQL